MSPSTSASNWVRNIRVDPPLVVGPWQAVRRLVARIALAETSPRGTHGSDSPHFLEALGSGYCLIVGRSFDEDSTQETAPPIPLPSRTDVSFLVLSGPLAGQYFKLPRIGGVIGRNTVDVQLTDPGISRRHARVERGEGGHFDIVDLESRYGVYVEGRRVQRRTLVDGERFQLSADTVLRIHYQCEKESEIFEQIQENLSRDALTGVLNRRFFLERLEQEMAYARRHLSPLSILMIDIDHFKRINNAHGHPVGDEVLEAAAHSLGRAVRTEDLLARYGGDELIVCARGYDGAAGRLFAERLVRLFRDHPVRALDREFPLTLSIGVASYQGELLDDMVIVARADAALFEAKRRGRDRVETWSDRKLP